MTRRELGLYNERTSEAQFLRSENQFLRGDRDHYRREWYVTQQRVNQLKERVEKVEAENLRLKQQNRELTEARVAQAAEADTDASSTLPQVKPSVVRRRRKKLGRKKGHPAALRPMPAKIDLHQDVPPARDPRGQPSCPHCSACMLEVEKHKRIVEDIIPARVQVTCYHTTSGWCPSCRKRVESRARYQPPAANIPHGQLGLNALATGVLLRIRYRLPFRQVAGLLADLPGLSVCPGAIARQVQRIAGWLEEEYEQLLLAIRASPQAYVDETSWRTDGRNGQLWTLATPDKTFYHIDKSRGGQVVRDLLGDAFGGTMVSDFYSAYEAMNCQKQKCLRHLLKDLCESAEKSPVFAASPFFAKAKKLIKQMLKLKDRWDKLGDNPYTSRICALESRLDQLADGQYDEPNAKRLAHRMGKHRKALTAFLWDKDLEGTNNIAERAIRPAVVARKISGGSRSDHGADAFAVLASLLRTAGQRGKSLLATIKAMLVAAWETSNPAVVPRT
jgi:hypothetical protein